MKKKKNEIQEQERVKEKAKYLTEQKNGNHLKKYAKTLRVGTFLEIRL